MFSDNPAILDTGAKRKKTKTMASSSLLAELKRRKVYRVAAVYAGVAWLLLQLASTVFEPLGIPDWTFRLVLLMVALGFPLALVLAWVFEWTGQGVQR